MLFVDLCTIALSLGVLGEISEVMISSTVRGTTGALGYKRGVTHAIRRLGNIAILRYGDLWFVLPWISEVGIFVVLKETWPVSLYLKGGQGEGCFSYG